MSQRTTRLRGPLAALLIALGVGGRPAGGGGGLLLPPPRVASAANASHPRDLPEGEAFLSAVQLSPHLGLTGDRHPGGDPGPRLGEIFTRS